MTRKLTIAEQNEIARLVYHKVCTGTEARLAFQARNADQIAAWHAEIEAQKQAAIAKSRAESAANAARRATWKKFEPVTHQCADCGADVVQTDEEVPPWVMYGPGWLCPECKAKHGAEALRRSHEAGRKTAAEIARSEANDRWERGEN